MFRQFHISREILNSCKKLRYFFNFLAGVEGLEPSSYGFGDRYSTIKLYTLNIKFNDFDKSDGGANRIWTDT